MRARTDDDGQAALLGVVWVAVAAVLTVALVAFAARLDEAQQAQLVADAVALAAVDGDRTLAERVAQLGGGEVVAIEWSNGIDGPTVEVVVRIGEHRATARASRAP